MTLPEVTSAPMLAAILAAGGTGALLRYGVLALCAHAAGPFPLGILAVNAAAAFAGAAAWAARPPEAVLVVFAGGLVGSIGTLSSLASELISLFIRRRIRTILVFLALTLVTGLLAAVLGLEAGAALGPVLSGGAE